MALDTLHVRSRSRSPQRNTMESPGWQRLTHANTASRSICDRRSSSPPSSFGRRPGLGSSSTKSRYSDYDSNWGSMRTGEPVAAKALRMHKRFVRATHLSDPSLAPTHSDRSARKHDLVRPCLDSTLISSQTRPLCPPEPPGASVPTLAQLYSQLAQDISTSDLLPPQIQQQPSASSSLTTSSSNHKQLHQPDTDQVHLHVHRHRHHPDARHRSEWFISRALTKMRRAHQQHPSDASTSLTSKEIHGSPASTDKLDNPDKTPRSKSSGESTRQRCPRCGDLLAPNATPEDIARHRQSIGHRLGLNAPVSSASASEAPSPADSEASTPPAPDSPPSAPIDASLLDASIQALQRRSARLTRRLTNAPRWKKIARDNVGHNLLSRMGWKEGMGLGVQEWKWHQLGRERLKRQRSNAVRALLRRASATQANLILDAPHGFPSGQSSSIIPSQHETRTTQDINALFEPASRDSHTESEWLQLLLERNSRADSAEPFSSRAAFPFQHDAQTLQQRRDDAQMWFQTLAGADLEWFQHLTADEQQSLESALLSGHITILDIQNALLAITDAAGAELRPESDPAETQVTDDAMFSNALLYPVQVELRTDRAGIGSKRLASEAGLGERQRRRSHDAEGSVEIRKPSSSSTAPLDGEHKKPRPMSIHRLKSFCRSRSHSSAARKPSDSTRRQRELAYQKDKRDWLDLRASLS